MTLMTLSLILSILILITCIPILVLLFILRKLLIEIENAQSAMLDIKKDVRSTQTDEMDKTLSTVERKASQLTNTEQNDDEREDTEN